MGEPASHKQQPVWTPTPASVKASRMHLFMDALNSRHSAGLSNWPELYAWSLAHPEIFWLALAEFTGVRFSQSPEHVLLQGDLMPGAQWFVGSRLNFAENLLRNPDDTAALVCRDERGRRLLLSRAELAERVAGLAAAMRQAGIQPGDRIAAVLPNCAEAVIAMLAAASIGAVFSSCSPDFGEQAIVDRFGQIQPRILFICDGYSYAGKPISVLPKLAGVVACIPEIETVVLVPFLATDPDISAFDSPQLFDDFQVPASEPYFEQLPFDHPLFILYSSGTTGRPKCILHSAGGTLLQHLKELVLHTDLSSTDCIFYFTTCGWMMWNWLVSALGTGARVVLYDGSPFYPDGSALWRMAAAENVSVFGTSPGFLTAVEKAGLKPSAYGVTPRLRTLLSTGAPLPPECFDFVHEHVGASVQLSSISGGTDLISCFALGNPLLPVYRGELQAPGLGMAVDVYNAEAVSLRGEPGELVCTQPFPSMPLGFWNDADGVAFHAAYFAHFPGVWTHGDLAEITSGGGLIIHGRSDATLNPGGVRIGTAEVCNPVLALPEVRDCIAVGQRWNDATRIVLFVVLREGGQLDEPLILRINAAIRAAASPRHVPAKILTVPEVPRTLSGKPVELAVRAVMHGEPVENLDAIANPAALEFFRDRPELR